MQIKEGEQVTVITKFGGIYVGVSNEIPNTSSNGQVFTLKKVRITTNGVTMNRDQVDIDNSSIESISK